MMVIAPRGNGWFAFAPLSKAGSCHTAASRRPISPAGRSQRTPWPRPARNVPRSRVLRATGNPWRAPRGPMPGCLEGGTFLAGRVGFLPCSTWLVVPHQPLSARFHSARRRSQAPVARPQSRAGMDSTFVSEITRFLENSPSSWHGPCLEWVCANTSRTVLCQYIPNS